MVSDVLRFVLALRSELGAELALQALRYAGRALRADGEHFRELLRYVPVA